MAPLTSPNFPVTLEAQGVQLVRTVKELAPALFATINASRTALAEFDSMLSLRNSDTASLMGVERRVARIESDAIQGLNLNCCIVAPPSSMIIGEVTCGLNPETLSEVWLGYWLIPQYQGRGIATAAVEWVVNYCFQQCGIPRARLAILDGNLRSIRLAARLGFWADESFIQEKAHLGGSVLRCYSRFAEGR